MSFHAVLATFFVTIMVPFAQCFAASSSYGEGLGVPDKINDMLIEIDTSGRHGESSRPGRDYDDIGRANRNQKGRDGGPASEAKPGTDGRDQEINLDVVNGNIVAFGYALTPEMVKAPFKFILDYGVRIRAIVRGGNGGSGNRGGNAQQGGKGSDGVDATRFSSATSGGRGAPGGDAGAGSSGKNAGNGATAKIGVKQKFLELLLLVRTYTDPARGGSKGCHGIPGKGGPGGDGGDGCSWTETESYTTTESDGKGGTQTVTKTRTVVKSRPPAPDGPSGPRGRIPSKVLVDGEDGMPGKVVYNVTRSDGTVTQHKKGFKAKLQWYEIIDEHGDGILEPGDKVWVKNLTLANEGDLEMPHGARIFVSVGDSQYTMTSQVELEVPSGLGAGESITFNEPLEFTVNKGLMEDAGPEPFLLEDSILPRAFVVNQFINAELEEFRRAIPIAIQYPIKIEAISRLNSLAAGEATKFSFKITNTSSKRAFGEDSELERAIAVWIQREGGDLDKDQLEFFAPNGAPIDIKQQMVEVIRRLKPSQSAILEGIVGMRPDAELYRSGVVGVGLELDTNEEDMHHIQHIPLNFSASADYLSGSDSDADYLLIANQELRQDTYQGWKNLVHSLGSELAIWDLSYYSFLDLLSKISDDGLGGKTSLAEDFKGKTIIIPDHLFEYSSGEMTRATELLKQIDLVKAQEQYGINFLILSDRGNTKTLFEDLRTSAPENFGRRFKAPDKMIENLDELNSEDNERASYTQTVVRSFVTKLYWWRQADEKHLIKEADKLSWKLAKKDPDSDYIVVHRFAPRRIRKLGKLFGVNWFPKYSLGTLEIRKMATKPNGLGVHLIDEEFNINSVPYIYSQKVLTGLLMATPLDRRIEILRDIVSENPDLSNESEKRRFDAVMDAVQFSIINEAEQALIQSWKGDPSMRKLAENLPALHALSKANIKLRHDTDEHIIKRFIQTAAQLKAIAEHNVPWYDRILPGMTIEQKIKKQFSKALGHFLKDSFEMKRQTWSWVGRLFDSKKKNIKGFQDHEVNNFIHKVVKSYLAIWKKLSHEDVIDYAMEEEFQTPVVRSRPLVLDGQKADEWDSWSKAREKSVKGNINEMTKNRKKMTVPHPGVVSRLAGRNGQIPSLETCVRLLEE